MPRAPQCPMLPLKVHAGQLCGLGGWGALFRAGDTASIPSAADPMETVEELVGDSDVRGSVTDEDMDDDAPCERSHDKPHDDDHTPLEEYYPLPPSAPSLTDAQCSEVAVLLQVLCALKLAGLFVLRSEGSLVLRLMTHLVPPHTDRGVHLLKTMFAVLVACPFLVR